MDEVSLQEWDEAGRAAASEAMTALDSMPECELAPLVIIDKARAIGSNSLDRKFVQALIDGQHLTESFLKNAS